MKAALIALVAAACVASPPETSHSSEPTHEEMERFCAVATVTVDLSRQERMVELLPVAPDQVRGSIKRASERQSSFTDDHLVDSLLEQCD